MTQEEFNTMLATAIAMGLGGGYYTSVYSGEEIDTLLALTEYGAGDPVISGFYGQITDAVEEAQAAAEQAAEAFTFSDDGNGNITIEKAVTP